MPSRSEQNQHQPPEGSLHQDQSPPSNRVDSPEKMLSASGRVVRGRNAVVRAGHEAIFVVSRGVVNGVVNDGVLVQHGRTKLCCLPPLVAMTDWRRTYASSSRIRMYQSGGGRRNVGGSMRTFPQYNVLGETCLLSLKFLPPLFKLGGPRGDILQVENRERGRLLLEWVPRTADGLLTRDRDRYIRFGLSAEELGLILDQLPNHQVEITRNLESGGGPAMDGFADIEEEKPIKVLRLIPESAETGAVCFRVDFELNGVGGQSPPSGEARGPMEVSVQLGEFMVIKEIMRCTIPKLLGWDTSVELALDRAIEDAVGRATRGNQQHRTQYSDSVPF